MLHVVPLSKLPQPLTTAATQVCSSVLGHCGGAIDRVTSSLADAARTTKFLRGRLDFAVRPDDVFISSYPRSGTTWTQLMVYLLCTGDHALEFEHLSEVSPWWERSLAWQNARPDDFASLPGPRIFKSHLPYRWLPRGGRYIYVQRNGADVALSYYHLYKSHLGYRGSWEQFFGRFLRGDLQYGSWFKHVAGWHTQRDNPQVLFLSYEEMKRDPGLAIARVGEFLGIEALPETVAAIARTTSFESINENEDKFDHIGELRLGRGLKRGQFIRTGQSAHGQRRLSATQEAGFMAALADASADQRPDIEWRIPDFLH